MVDSHTEEQTKKLMNYKKRVEELNSEKIRLEAELANHKKNLEELQIEAKTKLGIDVEKMPEEIEKLKKENDEILKSIEKELGVN